MDLSGSTDWSRIGAAPPDPGAGILQSLTLAETQDELGGGAEAVLRRTANLLSVRSPPTTILYPQAPTRHRSTCHDMPMQSGRMRPNNLSFAELWHFSATSMLNVRPYMLPFSIQQCGCRRGSENSATVPVACDLNLNHRCRIRSVR